LIQAISCAPEKGIPEKRHKEANKKLLFMKKTIFILTALIFCLSFTAMSQKTRVGITGGLVNANLSRTIGGFGKDGQYKIGLIGGLQLEVPLGKKNKFSFQPDLHYIQKNTSEKPSTPTIDKIYTGLRYAELAPNFVLNFFGKKKGAFYVGGGPFLSLPLPSKKVNKLVGAPKTETDVSFGNLVANDFKGVDYGGNVVMGYRTSGGIFISASYIQGARNLVPDKILEIPASANDKIKDIAFAIRLGCLINNKSKMKK
jgi:hypothetical protein